MPRTLITFLGATRVDPKTKERKEYDKTSYDFRNGEPPIGGAFFALALLEHLRSATPVDKLVVIGTSGSMWDAFALETVDGIETDEWDALDALVQAAGSNAVTQAQLNDLAPRLGGKLGVECRPIVIPYAIDLDDQISILEALNESLRPGDKVVFDLTHGFRHLPLVGLVSAMLLEATGLAQIEDIYYGALDMKAVHGGKAPVVKLSGLLRIGPWLGAMRIYDRRGDYAVFAPLLEQDGIAHGTARLLRDAAYFQEVQRIEDAHAALKKFQEGLDRAGPLPKITGLFRPVLEKKMAWIAGGDEYLRMRELAYAAIDTDDVLRAATLGFEAFLRRLPEPPEDFKGSLTPEERIQPAKAYLKWNRRAVSRQVYDAYDGLRRLRNALAHVDTDDAGQRLAVPPDAKNCHDKLNALFRILLPAANDPVVFDPQRLRPRTSGPGNSPARNNRGGAPASRSREAGRNR